MVTTLFHRRFPKFLECIRNCRLELFTIVNHPRIIIIVRIESNARVPFFQNRLALRFFKVNSKLKMFTLCFRTYLPLPYHMLYMILKVMVEWGEGSVINSIFFKEVCTKTRLKLFLHLILLWFVNFDFYNIRKSKFKYQKSHIEMCALLR